MEFADVLRHRKMVRNYTDEPVDREVVERFVALAGPARRGGCRLGTGFVGVRGAALRRRRAELAQEPKYVEAGLEPWISKAPVHVVVGMREESYHERYRKPDKLLEDGSEIDWHVPWWWVDAGKAMMLLLLSAIDEGLGAGLFGLFPAEHNELLREELGLPEDVYVVGVVTIGHAAPDDGRGSSRRKFPWLPLEEVVRWEHW